MNRSFDLTLYGINESKPGPRWQSLFNAVWPAYRGWYLSEGRSARPDLATAETQLRRHMPELVPTWRRMVELAGDDELAATMLTLWDTPKFLPGCSQAVLSGPEPALIRNYDYSPDLFEQVVYSSEFSTRKVIGTGDCIWGLLDGMNSDGLAVSLAFGGAPGSAPGFAAPLVVRYLLEVAGTTAEAKQRLIGLPVSMSYNLTMVDAAGETTTAYVAPGVDPTFFTAPVATNHRGDTPEFPEHARRFRSVERVELLGEAVEAGPSVDQLADRFLQRPLYSDDYEGSFGTLYTAVYRPADGEVHYRWRNDRWTRSFSSPGETKTVTLNGDTDGDLQAVPAAAGPSVAGPSVAGPSVTESEWTEFAEQSSAELGGLTRRMIDALSHRSDETAFAELLGLYETLGVAMGESARTLAEHGSWSRVAGVAGVSRQAAWYRWKE
ncbi:MAG TPA: C45 family peptidase [Propionibacteriaceae bacterium]